jgi:hypothetical protein
MYVTCYIFVTFKKSMFADAEAQDYNTSALGLGQVLEGSVSEDQVGLNACYLSFCYFFTNIMFADVEAQYYDTSAPGGVQVLDGSFSEDQVGLGWWMLFVVLNL